MLAKSIHVETIFHNVFTSVPKHYERDLIDTPKMCSYVYLFFPDSLPFINEILYFNPEAIVTGSLLNVWNSLKRSTAPPSMIGAVKNADKGSIFVIPENGSIVLDEYNSGMIVMNLTLMRELQWTKNTLNQLKRFRRDLKNEEQLFNVVVQGYRHKLKTLPCQYNMQTKHCLDKLECMQKGNRSEDIHVIRKGEDFPLVRKHLRKLFDVIKAVRSKE